MVLSGSISGGQFERVAAPGTAITTWTQADIDAGDIFLAQTGAITITNLRPRGSNNLFGAGINDTVAGGPSFTLSATTGNIDETANSASTLMATIIPTETVTPSYSLSGANAALFELTNGDSQLRLRSGQNLSTADGATRVVTVNLDDASTGAGIDASQTFVLSVWVQGGGPGY
jgi:hypothetical protein